MANPGTGPKKGQTAAKQTKVKGGAVAGKGKKVQTQPPGMPQGVHDSKNPAGCRCGRCSTKVTK